MSIVIKKAKIIDPNSPYNGKVVDIFIKGGKVEAIDKSLSVKAKTTIEKDNLHISPGWVDMHVKGGEPGYEHKETFASLSKAAVCGGFTDIGYLPNTKPTIDNRAMVEFVLKNTKDMPVFVHLIAALSANAMGKDLTEFYDMHQSGAVAFYDGYQTVQDAGLLERALFYALKCNGLVLNYPQDKGIANGGLVNEGLLSMQLGLPGIPALAEELIVNRDIQLLEETKSRLHVAAVSAKGSVQLIKAAKKRGLRLSASVNVANVFFTDEVLADFNTNFKVLPPLRTNSDVSALKKALKSGVIDMVSAGHVPCHEDEKKKELSYADYGMIGLESCFGALRKATHKVLSLQETVNVLSINPRKQFGLNEVSVEVGSNASFTLFNPDLEWKFKHNHVKSLSKNSGFIGETLLGKVYGIINKGKLYE